MSKLDRLIEIDGRYLKVPPFVNRTNCGWQTRVRGVPSRHFADAAYGGATESLSEAAKAVQAMLAKRDSKIKEDVVCA